MVYQALNGYWSGRATEREGQGQRQRKTKRDRERSPIQLQVYQALNGITGVKGIKTETDKETAIERHKAK